MDLDVVRWDLPTKKPSSANHPLPIHSGGLQLLRTPVPRKRLETTHFIQGQRDVPPVSNHVDEKRLRNVCLDLVNPENVIGIIERPALRVLNVSDFIHHNPHEIAAGPTFSEQLGCKSASVESRSPKTLTLKPSLHSVSTVMK